MTDRRRFLRACCLTLGVPSLLAGAGCQASGLGATVVGSVTLDDEPLTWGNVSFHPQGGGAVVYGAIQASGRYQLKTGDRVGIMPGEYAVTVVASELPPPTEKNPEPTPVLLTPAVYGDVKTSGLRATIQRGSNDVPLRLVRE